MSYSYAETLCGTENDYQLFPFDPTKIDFVLQTHAHIDFAGLLPKLSALGFEGPIYATAGTTGLLTFMLPDSGYTQEMEVEHMNFCNLRHGKPVVKPIYTRQDAEDCLGLFGKVNHEFWTTVGLGVRRSWFARCNGPFIRRLTQHSPLARPAFAALEVETSVCLPSIGLVREAHEIVSVEPIQISAIELAS